MRGAFFKGGAIVGATKIFMSRIREVRKQLGDTVFSSHQNWERIVNKWIFTRAEAHPCLVNRSSNPTDSCIIEGFMSCATGQAPGCDFSEEQNTCPFAAFSDAFCGKCTYCKGRFTNTQDVGMLRTMANVMCRPYTISETATPSTRWK